MSEQRARIARELHDEPHIEGSRVTVQLVKERVEGRGLDPQTSPTATGWTWPTSTGR